MVPRSVTCLPCAPATPVSAAIIHAACRRGRRRVMLLLPGGDRGVPFEGLQGDPDLLLGPDVGWRSLGRLGRVDVEDSLRAVRRAPPRLLDDERERVRLVQ